MCINHKHTMFLVPSKKIFYMNLRKPVLGLSKFKGGPVHFDYSLSMCLCVPYKKNSYFNNKVHFITKNYIK